MLFSLIGSKAKFIGLAVLSVGIAFAVAYHYYTINKLQSENTSLTINNNILAENYRKATNAAESNRAAILLLEEQRKIDQEKINELNTQYANSRADVNFLRKLLSDHDLSYLTSRKPGLIENRINNGTSNVGQRLEQLTKGAKNEK